MHDVERELIEATGFKPRKKYADRNEYLQAILLATTKLVEDEFDNLSDEAAEWCNEAVEIYNEDKNADLPDFGDVESDDSDVQAEDVAEADDGEADEGDDAASGDEDASDDVVDEAEAEIVPSDPEPVKSTRKGKAKKADDEVDAPAPSKAAKAPKKQDPEPDLDNAVLDKWGCMQGSKNSQALAMLEKGATMRELKAALQGATYYNLMKKQAAAGHKMEKVNGIFKLTHKDDVKKSKK
jgi:hypothetical protein